MLPATAGHGLELPYSSLSPQVTLRFEPSAAAAVVTLACGGAAARTQRCLGSLATLACTTPRWRCGLSPALPLPLPRSPVSPQPCPLCRVEYLPLNLRLSASPLLLAVAVVSGPTLRLSSPPLLYAVAAALTLTLTLTLSNPNPNAS